MNVRTCVLVLVFSATSWSACCAQEVAAQSALASVSLNNFAWKSFDLLIEEQSFEDKADLGAVETNTRHRIVFDDERQKGVYLRHAEATGVELGDQLEKAKTREQQAAFGGISNGTVTVYRRFPGPLATFNEPDFMTLYRKMACPNPRLFGQTLMSETSLWGERATDFVAHHQAIATNYKVSRSSIDVEAPFPGKNENRATVILWTLDKGTGLPSQATLATRHVDKNVDYPTQKEFFKWGEIEGLAVPTEVYVEKGQIAFDRDGNEVLNLKQTEYKLHWISLNAKHELAIPPIDTLHDLQKFREATNPSILKTRFIEVKEGESK